MPCLQIKSKDAFDAVHGLWKVGRDASNAQLLERMAGLSAFALASEFFWDGPILVIANTDAVAVRITELRHRSDPSLTVTRSAPTIIRL